MSALYTPGPWTGSIDKHMVPQIKAGPITIATLWLPPVGNAFANQRLISNSPEIFETLCEYREAVLYAQDKKALMSALRAVDDKARILIAAVLEQKL